MRHVWMTAILLLVALGSANPTRAQEPELKIPPELILERFKVNTGGDALLVPVKIAGKERLFLVDTGCTGVVIDPGSVDLGQPKRKVKVKAANGGMNLNLFHISDAATIGNVPLGVSTVAGSDLFLLRQSLGSPIEGILGMEFLKRHIVRVDFDRGEMLLLKSLPKAEDEGLPVLWSRGGTPMLEAKVGSGQNVRFVVDTGMLGLHSGNLEEDALEQNRDFRKVGSRWAMAASGRYKSSVFLGQQVSLGGFSVENPIFVASSTVSALGLGFWSRFIVTFDFPHNKIYLRKGKAYERPDFRDQTGMYLLPKNEGIVVDSVDDFSPASLAGIKVGDILLTLNMKRIAEMSPYETVKALCLPGELVCTVRRGSQELRLTLTLPR